MLRSSLCALLLVALASCAPNNPQDAPCNETSDCAAGVQCITPGFPFDGGWRRRTRGVRPRIRVTLIAE